MNEPTYGEGALAFAAVGLLAGQWVALACVYHNVGLTVFASLLVVYGAVRSLWCGVIWLKGIQWGAG